MTQRRPKDDDAPNRYRDAIQAFRHEYEPVLAEAKDAAEMTASPGWQRLCYARRQEDLEGRRRVAKGLKAVAESIEDNGATSEDLKALSAATMDAAEVHLTADRFRVNTIEAVTKPVNELVRIVDKFLARARREEQEDPLHNAGREELMRAAIAEQPLAVWNDERGIITIEARE